MSRLVVFAGGAGVRAVRSWSTVDKRRCPSAIPSLSFDTTGKSDAEVMRAFGMLEGETLSLFIGRTKGLIVMMAAIMQVRCGVGNRGRGLTGYTDVGRVQEP